MFCRLALFLVTAMMWIGSVEAYFNPHYRYGFPTYYHTVKIVDEDGKSVEIEDGSIWEVSRKSHAQVAEWKNGDRVVVSPRQGMGAPEFYLTNVEKRDYHPVALAMPPKSNSQHTCTVRFINYSKGKIELENNADQTFFWQVDPKDQQALTDWIPGQTVVIGANDNWYNSMITSYTSILVNCDQGKYIRVKLVK